MEPTPFVSGNYDMDLSRCVLAYCATDLRLLAVFVGDEDAVAEVAELAEQERAVHWLGELESQSQASHTDSERPR
jgi:hypothetical protein